MTFSIVPGTYKRRSYKNRVSIINKKLLNLFLSQNSICYELFYGLKHSHIPNVNNRKTKAENEEIFK